MRYVIQLRTPSGRAKVWAGPNSQTNIIPTPEGDRQKARRAALENKLKTLSEDENLSWNKRSYTYTVTLSEEQAKEVSAWDLVRTVIPKP